MRSDYFMTTQTVLCAVCPQAGSEARASSERISLTFSLCRQSYSSRSVISMDGPISFVPSEAMEEKAKAPL